MIELNIIGEDGGAAGLRVPGFDPEPSLLSTVRRFS